MSNREYPCITLKSNSSVSGGYTLWCEMSFAGFFIIEVSNDYQELAERGLRNSFHGKVPFYNEVKS